MSRQKQARFADNLLRSNVIEPGKPEYDQMKGRWNDTYFLNDHPITLELGCGRGEYTVGLGRQFPERNFVGVDVKGDRIWVGSGKAIKENLGNVAFLRTQVQWLPRFFETGEVDEIWLTFPDPRPKRRDEKRRLSNPGYMNIYQQILADDGWFRFKTDNTALFDYTLEEIYSGTINVRHLCFTKDLYQSELLDEHHGIKTRYEGIFHDQGEKIKYLKFQFDTQKYEECTMG